MLKTIRIGALAAFLAALAPVAQAQPANPQSANPQPGPQKARQDALTCYWSTAARITEKGDQIETVADAVWYLIEYLRTEGSAGDTLAQVEALSGDRAAADAIPLGKAPALAAGCRERHPRNSAAAVTLPADTFQRDTLCMATASLLVGFARGEQQDTGRSAWLDPASAVMDRFAARLDDASLAARGYAGDEAVTALISASLRTAPNHGSFTGIYRACAEAVPPAA